MRSFISLLPLLAAISGIFVGCHPLAGSPNNLAQRADGYASSFPGPAPNASFSPTDAELEGRQVGEIIEIAGAIVSLIGAIEEAIADSNVVRTLGGERKTTAGLTRILIGQGRIYEGFYRRSYQQVPHLQLGYLPCRA